jgi:RND family efflux transporter MFP subunit
MGSLVVLLVVGGITTVTINTLNRNKSSQTESSLTKVALISVKDFDKNKSFVSASGSVESLQQAELRSQAVAPVAKINVAVGDTVKAGQILVTLQNDDINAQLSQARASLKVQQANLDAMKKGTRTEELDLTQTKVDAARQVLENTTKQQNTLVANAHKALMNSTFEAVPDANYETKPIITGTYNGEVEGKYTVRLFGGTGGLTFAVNGLENCSAPVQINAVPLCGNGLNIYFARIDNLSIGQTWTISVPNTRASNYLANYNAYQNALAARDSAIDGAQGALASAESGLALEKAGATAEQIRAEEAVVEQAQATVENITAQLNKTIIRSPISGKIAALPVKYGELLTMGQSVVSIVNQSGLQVKAFISNADLLSVEKGADVTIGDGLKGRVNNISPSIDAKTRNVEVDVIVLDPEKSGLIVGQNITVKISAKSQADGTTSYLLPLQAVKITSDASYVFTVDEKALKEIKVTTGNVEGEFVEIKAGLTPEMMIVSPVYELKDGQKVGAE